MLWRSRPKTARRRAPSRATAVSACDVFDVVVEFQVIVYGAVVRSAPSALPSSSNCTPATPTSSDAVALMAMDAEGRWQLHASYPLG